MAKVSNREVYIPKEFLSLKDYFVITDSESFKRTKTVESKHVLNFINKNNGNSNSIYIFSNIQNEDFNKRTEGYFFSDTNQQNPDLATKLYFNFKNIFGENVSELFQAIVDSAIVVVKMVNTLDFNNIVYIKPKDILVYEEHFEFDITVLNGLSYGDFIDKASYVLNFELYNDKTIDISIKLDKSTYPGTAQDLDNDIKSIKFPDQILDYGDISLNGLNIIINANEFQWRLNQAIFNNAAFTTTIPAAINGFYRTDLLQVSSDNIIRIKTGNEDAILSTTPAIDGGHLALGSVNIFGNSIASTNTLDTSSFNVFSNGGPLDFTLVNSPATTLLIHNATSLTGFTIPSDKIQYGKDYYIRNSTGGPLTLRSITGTNNIRFYFAEGDLVVPVNNNVHLKYLSNGEFGGIGYLTLVGVNPNLKVDKVLNKSLVLDSEILRLSTVVNQDISVKADKITTYTKLESDSLITQLLGGAPADANTLKELNDKILAVQAIIGGGDADADAIVNTVKELLAVFATFPEGVDLVNLLAGKVNTTDVYNALDSIVAGRVLDARQGKVLNDLITALQSGKQNALVSGTNIKTFGGVSILGGGDIPLPVSGVITTTLQLASIPNETVAGFVTYLNTLATPLVLAANEIFKLQLTTSGRMFELLLRGRSFGNSQAAITIANVREVTDFLNRDVRLSNYLSTRNDGQLPSNRVLSTDVNGNLRLFTIATAPAPYIQELIPDSYLPSNTGNIRILGSFFTPAMCNRTTNPTAIILGGVAVINYANFISQGEILINVTTGSVEGSFPITLNNGLSTTKVGAFLIVLGTVFKPYTSDWTNIIQPVDTSIEGEINMSQAFINGEAKWNKNFNVLKNFRIEFDLKYSPLTSNPFNNPSATNKILKIYDSLNDTLLLQLNNYRNIYIEMHDGNGNKLSNWEISGVTVEKSFKLEYFNGILKLYNSGVLRYTFTAPYNNLQNNIYAVFNIKATDIKNIKYIELA